MAVACAAPRFPNKKSENALHGCDDRSSLLVPGQIALGDYGELAGIERFHGDVDVVDHQRHRRTTMGTDQKRIGLDDIHLGLQQGCTDLQQRLRSVGQLDAE